MTLLPLGDSAVVLVLGETVDAAMAARIRAFAGAIRREALAGLTDIVPAFASIGLCFAAGRMPRLAELRRALEAIASRVAGAEDGWSTRGNLVEIPVCYAGELGPDLADIAAHTGLSAPDVIALHTGGDYLVHAIGFLPGFPYLGGLPPQLATPRRATPRTSVPAGSVGIGGAQTGVYPLESPGGWNLIGRTPLRLFDVKRPEPALVQCGDRVRFRAIESEEFSACAPGAEGAEERERRVDARGEPLVDVLRAGMSTTVQDLGRTGWRDRGVPLSGAADPFASRLANALVGNADEAAVLECTLVGPDLRFNRDTLVAVTGAEFPGIPPNRPVRVSAGSVLHFGAAHRGARGYLAIAGGCNAPIVLGSSSTYVRAGLGGLHGRALRDGDRLHVGDTTRAVAGGQWGIDGRLLPAYSAAAVVRVIPGPHAQQFGEDWLADGFKVTARSDRMGVRLAGPTLMRRESADLLSMPVVPGTIQVPPDGQPIVLLADAQTIGGYPQIAHVITVDLPVVGQLRPGDTVTFRAVPLEEAQALLEKRERGWGRLRQGIAQKLA